MPAVLIKDETTSPRVAYKPSFLTQNEFYVVEECTLTSRRIVAGFRTLDQAEACESRLNESEVVNKWYEVDNRVQVVKKRKNEFYLL